MPQTYEQLTEKWFRKTRAIRQNANYVQHHHRKWWVFYSGRPGWITSWYRYGAIPVDFSTACRFARGAKENGWRQVHITTKKDWVPNKAS